MYSETVWGDTRTEEKRDNGCVKLIVYNKRCRNFERL